MFFRNPKDSIPDTIDQSLRIGMHESGTNQSVRNQYLVSRNKGMRNRERNQNIAMQMPNQLQISKSYQADVHLPTLEPETRTRKGLLLCACWFRVELQP